MLKIVIALLLLPVSAGSIIALKRQLHGAAVHAYFFSLSQQETFFLAGIISYVLIHFIFYRPLKTYVIGHELTHAFAAWIFDGHVANLKATAKGGGVSVSRTNWFICLSPYFIPIYSILGLVIYGVCNKWITPLDNYLHFVTLFLGLTWAFHVVLTIYALQQDQPDLTMTGVLFSISIIFAMNLQVLAGLLAFVSPSIHFRAFYSNMIKQSWNMYYVMFNYAVDIYHTHIIPLLYQAIDSIQ